MMQHQKIEKQSPTVGKHLSFVLFVNLCTSPTLINPFLTFHAMEGTLLSHLFLFFLSPFSFFSFFQFIFFVCKNPCKIFKISKMPENSKKCRKFSKLEEFFF